MKQKENVLTWLFSKKRDETIFMIVGSLFSLFQFILFYICVNGRQIVLAFTEYDELGKQSFAGFANFSKFIWDIFNDPTMGIALKNSVIFLCAGILNTLIAIIVSFCIWKQVPAHGFFKMIFLLPSILSISVFVMIYRYTVIDFLPGVFKIEKLGELLLPPDSMWTVIVIGTILSVGSQSILFTGAMNNVSMDVREYARIDGFTIFHEFIYLVLPQIYPTWISYFIISLSGFFSGYGLLYVFFNTSADYACRTIGYTMFVKVYTATSDVQYPYAAAAGCLFTMITVPVVLGAKKLLEKIGPKDE